MPTDQEQLNERLIDSDTGMDLNDPRPTAAQPTAPLTSNNRATLSTSVSQWSEASNDRFYPSGESRKSLSAGVYNFNGDDRGLYIQRMNLLTDTLIELDDAAGTRVLDGIRTFWASEKEYTSRGIIYKRGILFWGPAGSGKTALVTQLSQELVRRGGLVIWCGSPELTATGLSLLRRIEPLRPLIVILEDIEELIRDFGEHKILALLDGELQVGNVVNIATTNFPELLGARIVNRPSRFDERILIGMPSEKARFQYLRWITKRRQ